MSWDAFVVGVLGITALVLLLMGFAIFITDELRDDDEP